MVDGHSNKSPATNHQLPTINSFMKLSAPKFDTDKIKTLSQKIFQDKFERMLEDLIDLERDNPTDMRIKQKIAEIHFKKDRLDDAVAKYEEIAKHYEQEDFTLKAIRAYKNILKIDPTLIEHNLKLASLYVKLGLTNEAANQYRIAINHYASLGDSDKTIFISQNLVKVDPSPDNRAKLAEIYQSFGMTQEAVKQYELLAKHYRLKKDYSKLLHYYELILPHQTDNKAIFKDVCVLQLRNQRPDRVLQLMDHYKMTKDPKLEDLAKKAQLMMEAMKKHK